MTDTTDPFLRTLAEYRMRSIKILDKQDHAGL